MFKSILFKFHLLLLGILLLSFFIFSIWLNNLIRDSQIEQAKTNVTRDIQMHAKTSLQPQSFEFGSQESSPEIFKNFFSKIQTSDIVQINAWDTESRVIFSDYQQNIGKIFANNDVLRSAIGGVVKTVIMEPNQQENVELLGYTQLLEVYVPIYFGSSARPIGVIEAYYNMDGVNQLLSKIRWSLLTDSLIVIAIIFTTEWVLFWFLVRKRLAVLIKAAHEVAGGNMDVHAEVDGKDEIGEYAEIFNSMASKLNESYEGMEQRIQDRTRELEKENKIMVGRELKMIELKKEIEDLKKKIGKDNSDQKNG